MAGTAQSLQSFRALSPRMSASSDIVMVFRKKRETSRPARCKAWDLDWLDWGWLVVGFVGAAPVISRYMGQTEVVGLV